MDQGKIGRFLKTLRKEKGFTQEQLAETLGVSNRSVSRWENGVTMPDFDLMIELAKLYEVEIGEILDGERIREKELDTMDQKTEDTLYKVAEYTNDEREKLMKRLHIFAWVGAVANILFIGLNWAGLAETGFLANVADVCGGFAFGILLVAVLYTSPYIGRIQNSSASG